MEELYIAILERIENEMPEIAYIDEDYGQLEGMNSENEDFYPVTFPCVLVGNTEADWKDIGLGTQAGEITLTVRLGIDCYHDTHIGSGTTGHIKKRMEMAGKLYRTLQNFQFCRNMDELVRVKSRDYTLPGNIKVYEFVFSFSYRDESALLDSRHRP